MATPAELKNRSKVEAGRRGLGARGKPHDADDIVEPKTKKRRLSPTPEKSSSGYPLIRLEVRTGDLFDHPTPALLIHACNCLGHWGKGVALSFKQKYPRHYAIYEAHCRSMETAPDKLLGTALLISPQSPNGPDGRKDDDEAKRQGQDWIGCLFTRVKPGKSRARSKKTIDAEITETLRATGEAMEDLIRQVEQVEQGGQAVDAGAWAMPQINSGLFGVEWARTSAVLEGLKHEIIGDGMDGEAPASRDPRDIVIYVSE